MARPTKNSLEYFSHDVNCRSTRTMETLLAKYGNDGYAVWFKTLELLGGSDGCYFDISVPANWEYYQTRMQCDEERLLNILELLATLDAIDAELYSYGIIWSDNFIERHSHVWEKRTNELPTKPQKTPENRVSAAEMVVSDAETPLENVSDAETPHSIVKNSIVKNSIFKNVVEQTRQQTEDEPTFSEIIPEEPIEPDALEVLDVPEVLDSDDVAVEQIVTYLNERTGAHYRSKTKATKQAIKARLAEGYTPDDFRTVIDKKCVEWMNTDFEKFLRPETLFRPSHFESYLNQRGDPKTRGHPIEGNAERLRNVYLKFAKEEGYEQGANNIDNNVFAGLISDT